jgi:hypothetical protein
MGIWGGPPVTPRLETITGSIVRPDLASPFKINLRLIIETGDFDLDKGKVIPCPNKAPRHEGVC